MNVLIPHFSLWKAVPHFIRFYVTCVLVSR